MITLFTPTYNRSYTLLKLYHSLLKQTNKNFEWLIVDDGSHDNTEELIQRFISESKIDIKYSKHPNGGKHRAINKGVQLAKGELFFIVDSDDYLSPDAVEKLFHYYNQIKENNYFVGVSAIRIRPDGLRIGGDIPFSILDTSALDLRVKHHIAGDMAEAYKTEVLKKYPFPEIEGETFCPESVIWNRIATEGKLRYFNEGIYICEYLPDGLTAKITRLRMNSPEASLICYSELYQMDIPILQRIKAAINFWRFSFCSNRPFASKLKQIGFESLPMFVVGYIMHLNDNKK